MQLPKELTTVTPLSKAVALLVFIVLPFMGFYLGVEYQKQYEVTSPAVKLGEISITPTPTVLATNAPTPTTSKITKTYTDNDVKLTFTYPDTVTVKAGEFTPMKRSEGQFAEKDLILSDSKGNDLILRFSTLPTGCLRFEEEDLKFLQVDELMTKTSSGRFIARYKADNGKGGKLITYLEYSSEVKNQGYADGCSWLELSEKTYPELDDNNGYFYAHIKTTNLNQDWSEFDEIVRTMSRL